MAEILVVGIHVFLMQKITKLLEIEGHNVIAIYPGRDLLGVNLRNRQFDYILISADISPKFSKLVEVMVEQFQQHCTILDAVYDRKVLLNIVS